MGKLNTSAWIKTSVIVVLSLLPFFSIDEPKSNCGLHQIMFVTLFSFFGSILLPVFVTSSFWDNLSPVKMNIKEPKWGSGLPATEPLAYFQFAAYLFIGISLGVFLATLLRFNTLNPTCIIGLCVGIGLLIGIRIRVKKNK